MNRTDESRQRLWIVPAPLVIWAMHFMLCYITAALACGMAAGAAGAVAPPLTAFILYTACAFAGIFVIAWLGYRALAYEQAAAAHANDSDSPVGRHRFIGLATLLVAGLSGVAVVYSTMAVVMIRTCE